jgi:HSP20 family molecular chaperone IbpA
MAKEIKVRESADEAVVPERVETGPLFAPQVDIIERAESMVILADMPGVSKDKVEVVLENEVLTIEGEVEQTEQPGTHVHVREYDVGNFHRCFTVGEGLDPAGVEATMKDGVLRLVIPKTRAHQARRIEIKGQ